MRERSLLWLGVVAVALLAGAAAQPAWADESAGGVLKKYRGDWGCFFEAQSVFGPIKGLELIHIDRAGNVLGEETVAYAGPPFLEAQTIISGQMSPQPNGSIQGVLTLHVVEPPGIPDVLFDILCEGVVPQGDRYTEMRCLDVFPQPPVPQPDGSKVVGLLQCKSR